MKLKYFCKAKDTSFRQATTYRMRKDFTNYTFDRGQIFKIYKELKKLDIKKTNNPVKNWGTNLNRILNRGSTNG